MKKNWVPSWKKRTPTNFPELKREWEEMYKNLSEQGIKKSARLQMIGDKYGVSRITVGKYFFRNYKNSQKIYHSEVWGFIKDDPTSHEIEKKYRANYQRARYHRATHIRTALDRLFLAEALTLDAIANCIEERTDVLFNPKSLIKYAVVTHKKDYGFPLLEEVQGRSGVVYYKISEHDKLQQLIFSIVILKTMYGSIQRQDGTNDRKNMYQ